MTNPTKSLGERLRLKSDAVLWFWPDLHGQPGPVRDLASDRDVVAAPGEASVAFLRIANRAAAVAIFDEQREALAELTAVWLIYPKGNRTDVNRDSLWALVGDYGWTAVANISVDEEHSSVRVRPLKPGEAGR